MISLPSTYIGASKGFWLGSGPYIYLHKLEGDLSKLALRMSTKAEKLMPVCANLAKYS